MNNAVRGFLSSDRFFFYFAALQCVKSFLV